MFPLNPVVPLLPGLVHDFFAFLIVCDCRKQEQLGKAKLLAISDIAVQEPIHSLANVHLPSGTV